MTLLKAYTYIPNFRGKNFFGQKLLKWSQFNGTVVQKMLSGFLLELQLSDRMQAIMYIKRCHEPETELIFKKMAQDSKVFLDVGANIGYFSCLVKQVNPACDVYSFEPLPQNIRSYKKNQELNCFDKIHLQEVCVADKPGKTEFLIPPQEESGWGRMAHRDLFSGEKIERDVITLDDFCKQKNISRVDFMKIDVEGYEYKVLEGAQSMIVQNRPKICIELNEPCLLDTGTSGEEIFAFLKKLNYKMYALNRSGDLQPVQSPLPFYEYLNYFALPDENASVL